MAGYDGEPTGATLPGTSAINPRRNIPIGEREHTAYQGRVYVITGWKIQTGEDAGEEILADATVLRALD